MTLLIAGYQYEKSGGFLWSTEANKSGSSTMEISGLFAASDSAITTRTKTKSGRKVLLNGFRKIYEMDIKLWKPYIMPGGSFKDYLHVYSTSQCFIGFAGNTLTAQHILNSITEHLSKLRIGCSPDFSEYQVFRHCQKNNPLYGSSSTSWDENFFLNKNFQDLLTGELVSDIVEYSINEALRSASSYKSGHDGFQELRTDLVCGVWCQSKERHELYVYRILDKAADDGGFVAYTKKELLGEREIVVLGLKDAFMDRAQKKFEEALLNFEKPSEKIYEFIGECIDEIHQQGTKEIDRPIALKILKESKVSVIK